MELLKRLFGAGKTSDSVAPSTRRVSLNDPLIINAPRIGFLNLLGSSAQTILEEDEASLARLFASSEESHSDPPVCDVLMIYARVETDGSVAGSSENLRGLIRKSCAPIVIVASENPGKNYVAAGKRPGDGKANLVMTLRRKGPIFAQFFGELFRRMFEGQTMPLAWVELAPQNPTAKHDNCPESVFAAEVSHIIFRR